MSLSILDTAYKWNHAAFWLSVTGLFHSSKCPPGPSMIYSRVVYFTTQFPETRLLPGLVHNMLFQPVQSHMVVLFATELATEQASINECWFSI